MRKNSRKTKEIKIVLFAVLGTAVIAGGFAFVQGPKKVNQKPYVAGVQEVVKDSNLTKDNFKVIDNFKIDNMEIYNIYCDMKINSKDGARLVELLKEDENLNDNYKIYVFNEKDKASELTKNSYSEEINTESTLITPVDSNTINISNSYKVDDVESIPGEYEVISINDEDNYTKIELILNSKSPKEALSQMKLIGQSIKDLNSNKTFKTLKILAYNNKEKTQSWEYDGNYKNIVTKNKCELLK